MSTKKKPAQNWPYVTYSEAEKSWKVDARTKDGGSRRFFATKAAAEVFASQCRIHRDNEGTSVFGNAELARYGKTVRDAVDFYLAHLRRAEASVPVPQAIEAHLATIAHRSVRYRNSVRQAFDKFAAEFGSHQIGAIDVNVVQDWIASRPGGAETKNTLRRRIAPMFGLALKKGWRADDPFAGGRKAKIAPIQTRAKKVKILSIDQVTGLLESASDETLPFWALAIFAGLRPESEILRLRWEDIHTADKELIVDNDDSLAEEQTKTGRRVVKMSDNLVAWLAPYAGRTGAVTPPGNIWKRLQADKRKVGFGTPGRETPEEKAAGTKLVPWIEDVTRHTYGSYLLARCGDVGVVSTQMGNSPRMVQKHYLRLVSGAAAATFWSIAPAKGAKVVRMRAA